MRVITLVLVGILNLAIESNFVFATELTVSDKGLGGISQNTKFDQKEIQGLLNGYTVKAETPSKLKDAYTLFVIMDQESRGKSMGSDSKINGVIKSMGSDSIDF
jgi:hypothetical protein